jgi:polar amino acid transport system substrate-binding protein
MTLRYRTVLLVLSLLFLAGSISLASSEAVSVQPEPDANGTVTGLVQFVNEAVFSAQSAGKEQALKEFSDPNGSFTLGNRYIWAYDFDCMNLAHPWHPEYAGTNKADLTDPSGFKMIRAMRDIALNGTGFVRYQYENPASGLTEPKLAYVRAVDDTWWIASGIYGSNLSLPSDTPEPVRDMLMNRVDEAVSYVHEYGSDTALSVFNNQTGIFTTNDTYIFAFDRNGTTLSHPFHPDKIGVNESGLVDLNGVSIGQEKLGVAADGGGFLYYVFNNPDAGGVPQLKISYVRPATDDLVLGAGIYLPVPASFSTKNRDALTSQVKKAVSYLNEQGKDASIREFNNPNGSFSDPDRFVFLFDTNGTLLANPFLPGLTGMNLMNDRDPYGKYPVRQFIRDAQRGGGYSYYFSADPGSDYTNRLKLAYTEPAEGNLVVGAGISSGN